MAGLDGKVALVTGGGKGLGQAIALALAARGVKIVVTGRDEKALGETVGEIAHGGGRARHLVGDARDGAHLAAAVARAVDSFGGLDIVVANARKRRRIELGSGLAEAEEILTTNLLGTYGTFHAAVPRMNDGGRLVAMSSVLGKFGVAGQAATCASQAALLGLVRGAALELAPRRITCNAIVTTPLDVGDPAERGAGLRRSVDSSSADRRLAEVTDLVLFACSAAADGISGQALSVCGGMTALG